jgi:hypothetical protein
LYVTKENELMRNLTLIVAALMLAVLIAACGGPQTTAVPTADPANATGEASVTPNPEGADEGTVEATADMTDEATAEATDDEATDEADSTAEATAEGTDAAMESGFAIQITGGTDGDIALDSDDGAVVVASAAGASTGEEGLAAANTGTDAQASSSGQQVLDTPSADLRTLTFTNADQSYTFDLIFSADLAPGQYEIGINNVQTTIGNNVNENSAGETSSEAVATDEATSEADAPAGASTSTAQSGGSTAENTTVPSADDSSASLDSNAPPSNSIGDGVVERDETFAPTIAARLESSDADALSYNLVQSGMLNIESMDDSSASGSFQFTLSPADDPTQTITVTGSFTNLPLGDIETEDIEAEPTTAVDVEAPATSEATAVEMEATEETTAAP